MTASSEPRRRRYVRQTAARSCTLTPAKLTLLRWIGELRIASLPQLARVTHLSEKATRRHCRALFDSNLVTVIPVARFAVAEASGADPSLLWGSAPNIYALTKQGLKLTREAELIESPSTPPTFGPGNSLFLAHELGIRDVRIYLELAAGRYADHQLEQWLDGEAACIELEQSGPVTDVRPDAWFIYRLARKVLVGFVEYDRGTERGTRRWKSKIAGYEALFAGDRLKALTGYSNARVLAIAQSPNRRDNLAALIAEHAASDLQPRFWLTDRSLLDTGDLAVEAWCQPGSSSLRPLIPAQVLTPGERGCL